MSHVIQLKCQNGIAEAELNALRAGDSVELTGQVRDEELAPAVREDLLNLYWRWFSDQHPRPA